MPFDGPIRVNRSDSRESNWTLLLRIAIQGTKIASSGFLRRFEPIARTLWKRVLFLREWIRAANRRAIWVSRERNPPPKTTHSGPTPISPTGNSLHEQFAQTLSARLLPLLWGKEGRQFARTALKIVCANSFNWDRWFLGWVPSLAKVYGFPAPKEESPSEGGLENGIFSKENLKFRCFFCPPSGAQEIRTFLSCLKLLEIDENGLKLTKFWWRLTILVKTDSILGENWPILPQEGGNNR